MRRLIKFLLYVVGISLLSRAWYIYWVKENEKAAMLYAIPGAVMLITAIVWEVYTYFSISKQLERQNKKAALITVKLETPKIPRQRITDMNWYNYIGEAWELFVNKLKYERFNLKVANVIIIATALMVYLIGSIWHFNYYREVSITLGVGGVMLLSLGFYIKKGVKEYREERRQKNSGQKPVKKKLAQVWVNDVIIFLTAMAMSAFGYVFFDEVAAIKVFIVMCGVLVPINHVLYALIKMAKERKKTNLQNYNGQNYWQQFKAWRKSLFKEIFAKGFKSVVKLTYFIAGALLGLFVFITDNFIAGIVVFSLWSIMYYALYWALSKILGDNAEFKTFWFTGVGENQVKFIVDQSGQPLEILTPSSYSIGTGDLDGVLVKKPSNTERYFGGLYWVGIPPIKRIFTYNWKWSKINESDGIEPVFREEEVHGLRINQQQYITARNLETKGLEKVNYGLFIRFHSIFPKKQLFRNNSPGDWLTIASAQIESTCRDYVATKSFTELNSEAEYKGKNHANDSIYNKLRELSGHTFTIEDGYLPLPEDGHSNKMVWTIGVAITDVEILVFESAEAQKFKDLQLAKQEEVYLTEKEIQSQLKLDAKQDGENRRLLTKADAESTADIKRAVGKTKYIKDVYGAINDANGQNMHIAEQLKESKILSLGSNSSMILNVDEHLKNKKEEEKEPKKS